MSKKKAKRVRKPHYIVTTVKCQKCKEKTAQIYNPHTKEFLCVQCYEGPAPLELCLSCGMREIRKLCGTYKDCNVERALKLIRDSVSCYGPKIAVACNWDIESMVILHLVRKVKSDIPIFTVLTPFLAPEILKFKDKIIKEWSLKVQEYFTGQKVPWSLHVTDPKLCCEILKELPLTLAVKDLECCITSRANYVETAGLVNINPISDWPSTDIWRYAATYGISVNPLYSKGFCTIDCLPCSFREVK